MNNITEISLTEGCAIINSIFKNEKELVENLEPKLKSIIKEMYGLNVVKTMHERHYKTLSVGYFNIFVDIYAETEEGIDIVIECKNPKQIKQETFSAFSQLMSYQFLLEKVYPKREIKYILATSKFDFVFFEFIKRFNLKCDIIINNENTSGFWINEF